MKYIFSTLVLALIMAIGPSVTNAQSPTIDYTIYDQLLQKYVSNEGLVDYSGIGNDPVFNRLTTFLAKKAPNDDWSKEEAMAFWINTYNIYTIQLMVNHMPVKSIMDIENAWDNKFIRIEGQLYSLNQIEHEILRKKYFDPRIHFAVNCASFSCPKLHNKAFTAKNLELLLGQLAKGFVNDPKRNVLSGSSAQISQLFDWYKDDFTKNGSIIEFINKYANTPLAKNASITYLEYNWSVNSKK